MSHVIAIFRNGMTDVVSLSTDSSCLVLIAEAEAEEAEQRPHETDFERIRDANHHHNSFYSIKHGK